MAAARAFIPGVKPVICRFAAEPPQDDLPTGDWADRLREDFLAACLRIDGDPDEIGAAGELVFHPDRTWSGRTYVPITARTDTGVELYGHVSFIVADPETDAQPSSFETWADYADETADEHPEWKLDLNADVVGGWRGEHREVAAMTLVWGRRLLPDGDRVTAELGDVTVDSCPVVAERFTLLAPDAYGGDYLEVALRDGDATAELARESLYEDVEGDED